MPFLLACIVWHFDFTCMLRQLCVGRLRILDAVRSRPSWTNIEQSLLSRMPNASLSTWRGAVVCLVVKTARV